MREPTAKAIRLEDYSPPAYLIDTVHLDFDIREDHTTVSSTLAVRRNSAVAGAADTLALNGDELELVSVRVDGRELKTDDYEATPERLAIAGVPGAFTLEIVNRIRPHSNTKLEGLYAAANGLFTQCEAEGFRRITYFLDRPDVMARYTVTMHADRERYPVLLSNGNRVGGDHEAGDRHWARWEDPFPKPSYLFALVAGRLDRLADTFITRSGRQVALEIYVEPGKLDQTAHAMAALKKSMRWDEEVFGLEVDLDCYMIVAVGDFNMGAMENKGLNIFNTRYVLARAETATDADFANIDRVVAHEYFHNWTGNRVTCRDWFQLSLKEGLTVFRDQEFGADHYSRAVTRIDEVRRLRSTQFPEDAGPMAHAVRPQSYLEISNFYTATVYEKGAEVVRMIRTLIGRERFRKGMDLYFERHDGQAVTTDDFARAMQDASGFDLRQFKRWYDQAGTPTLDVTGRYDPTRRTYVLRMKQSTPPTPGQPKKLPLHLPFAIGLVGPNGEDLPLEVQGETGVRGTTRILSLTGEAEERTFVNVAAEPVPSLNRDFSAPVIVRFPYGDAALAHLMAHDSDAFCRWEAGQQLATNVMLELIEQRSRRDASAGTLPPSFVEAFARVLADAARDPAFTAEALALPGESYLAEQMPVADPDAIHATRVGVRRALARALRPELLATYHAMANAGPHAPDPVAMGRRALRNTCLGYLMELADDEIRALCLAQFDGANNMTEVMAALAGLANCDCSERVDALDRFYARWSEEALVVDKWLSVQSTSRLAGTLDAVRRLLAHPAFEIRNPNKVRALVFGFCAGNPVRFHAADGTGYAFAAERVLELDRLNPQLAARLARSFDRWRKLDPVRQTNARVALERIQSASGLSKDTLEVVGKALA